MTKIIHVTTVHRRNDIRIFQKEVTTLSRHFENVELVVNDGLGNALVDGIEITDLEIKTTSRLSRFFKPFFALLSLLKNKQPDIVHFHDPELMIMGIIMAFRGCSVIYDSHEDLAKDILDKVWIPKVLRRFLSASANIFEHVAIRFFTAVIFVIESQTSRLGFKKNIVLHNYPILSDYPDEETVEAEPYFIHIGTLSVERGLREMLDATELLPPEYSLHIVGKLSDEAFEIAREHPAWNRITYTQWIDRKKLIPLIRKAIGGLLLFYPLPNMYNSSPNKLFEYMASGIPVIASDFPVFREILDKNKCGLLVNPQEHRSVLDAMMQLIQNTKLRNTMGKNGIGAVRNFYSWESESRKLIGLYSDILSGKG